MIWSLLIVGVLFSGFATVMFWREVLVKTSVSFVRLVLLIWLPGLVGSMVLVSFWILLIMTLAKKM